MTTTTGRRLCFPSGILYSSGNKFRSCCHCGYVTSPRVTQARADEALREHGWTAAPGGCAICRLPDVGGKPWQVFRPLDDGECEVWVCKNLDACAARYEAANAADKLKCGCKLVYVKAFGHYHSQQVMSDVAGGVPK